MSQRAWEIFTGIEKAGWLRSSVDSGAIAAQIEEVRAAREKNLGRRRDALTGISEFPNLTEKPVQRPAAPQVPSGGLPVHRYAEGYEALREASDEQLAATGKRPAIFLATLGSLAEYTARATFATNLFAAGGVEVTIGGAVDSVEEIATAFEDSGATVACICGTDKAYTELAGWVASTLKDAGAATVLLAGKEKPEYRESGVDGFVFTGCDALAVLRDLHQTLGVQS